MWIDALAVPPRHALITVVHISLCVCVYVCEQLMELEDVAFSADVTEQIRSEVAIHVGTPALSLINAFYVGL